MEVIATSVRGVISVVFSAAVFFLLLIRGRHGQQAVPPGRVWCGGCRLSLLGLPVLLSGCATLFDAPRPVRDEVFVHIQLVDNLPHGQYGVASCTDAMCNIRLRRDAYPYCLLHEIRHPFEGNFHAGQRSIEDCQAR